MIYDLIFDISEYLNDKYRARLMRCNKFLFSGIKFKKYMTFKSENLILRESDDYINLDNLPNVEKYTVLIEEPLCFTTCPPLLFVYLGIVKRKKDKFIKMITPRIKLNDGKIELGEDFRRYEKAYNLQLEQDIEISQSDNIDEVPTFSPTFLRKIEKFKKYLSILEDLSFKKVDENYLYKISYKKLNSENTLPLIRYAKIDFLNLFEENFKDIF